MHIIKENDLIILKNEIGEGLLYSVTGSLLQPFELIKTLSKEEVKQYETNTKNN